MHDKSQTYVRNVRDTMMQRITLRLPEQQINLLQQMVDTGEYPNVSEAVRAAVRELVEKRASRVLKESDQVSFKV
jgi:antitoxin ParD1/3/4